MSEQTIDLKKRKFLTKATIVVGAVGVGFVAWPFLSTWKPSAQAKAAGAPVDVDISKLEVGQLVRVLWRRKPVWIFKRNEKENETLLSSEFEELLDDPYSVGKSKAQQPAYAQNPLRTIPGKENIAVMVGVCTHLGCSPTYRPEPGAADLGGSSWKGGFYCPCHGSKFDLAGRVYSKVPAPTNLLIPPYEFISENIVRIGTNPA